MADAEETTETENPEVEGAAEGEATQEAPTLNVFVTDGASAAARAINQGLVAAGHKVYAMTDGRAGATVIRKDGGLPVYPEPTAPGEIRANMTMAESNVVVHVASQRANPSPFLKSEYTPEMLREGTRATVEAAKAANVEHFVYVSFAMLYGNTGGEMADEDMALTRVKHPLLDAARDAEQLVTESGLHYTILRAGYIYGPQAQAMRQVSRLLLRGRPVHTGGRGNYATWITAADLARAVQHVLEVRPEADVLNIVDDEPASPQDFVNYLASAQGVEAGGFISELLKVFTVPGTRVQLSFSTKAGNARAKDVLDWELELPNYREGIDDMLLTWRSELAEETQALPARKTGPQLPSGE